MNTWALVKTGAGMHRQPNIEVGADIKCIDRHKYKGLVVSTSEVEEGINEQNEHGESTVYTCEQTHLEIVTG